MHQFKYRALPVVLSLFFLLCFVSPVKLSGFHGDAFAATDPDLIIESITWTPELPSIGENVIFVVTIKNNGGSPTGSFYFESYIDDTRIDNYYVNPIYAGSIMRYVFTWKAKAGEHIVRAVCDTRDDVIESNEDNNDRSYAFSVLAPDLVIAAIEHTPESPSINQKVDFTITVKNQGNLLATASSLLLSLDGKEMGHRNISPLEPGEGATATYSTLATVGEHSVEAFADVLEQVKEGNESNNKMSQTFFAAMPDLVIDKITWSPTDRSEDENIAISITVKNIGSGNAAFSKLGFYIDDICQTAISVDGLSVNATAVKTVSFPLDANAHTLKAVADATKVLVESDESNNLLSVTMPALKPDLIIQSITWSPETPLIAHQMSFTVTVKNQGTRKSGPFEVAFHVKFYNKGVQICTSLDPGATAAFVFPWTTQEETLSVDATADDLNYIDESNENNNTARADIGFSTPTPHTDLSIDSVTCNPAAPSIGDAVEIITTLKNSGPGSAPPFHVAYYIDDTLLDSVYQKEMPSAGFATVNNIIWYAESGVHVLKVVADCNNSVFETNENNNEKTVTLTTAAPDLVIKSITWYPVNPGIGEEAKFTLTVKNQGDEKAASSYLTYYIDGVSRGNHFVSELEPGATLTRTFTWTMQAASHVFKAVIDEADDVPESQEYNNEKTVFLPSPDLLVTDITCSPENPSENTTITFFINIANQGEGPSPESRAVYYFDGEIYASRDIGVIQPGVTVTDNFTWTAKAGKHVLRAVADGTNLFVETNESNNAMEVIAFIPVTSSVETPVLTPVSQNETEPAAQPLPEPTAVTTPSGNGTKTDKTTEISLPEGIVTTPDIAENISETSADSTPMWKKILLNRLLIIAVAVAGLAAISLLLVVRKRAGKAEPAENQPKQSKE